MKSSGPFPLHSRFPFLSFLLIFACAGFSAHAAIVIDDFTVSQTLTGGADGTATGSGIIGGERNVITDGTAIYINSTYGSGCHLVNTTSGSNNGFAYIVYDGNDGSTSIQGFDGLGHVDLTGGGQYDGFLIPITQISGNAGASLSAWQGSQNGWAAIDVPDQPQDVFIPFADFQVDIPASIEPEQLAEYSLIDFADVGYIRLDVWVGQDSSCTIGSITVVPEPASLVLLALGGLILRRRT